MLSLLRPTTSLARTRSAQPQVWDPWEDVSRLQQQMDDFVARSFGYTPFSRLADAAAWAPPVELQENAQAYLLRAYVPGMSQEDLNLEVTGDRISLSGERRRTPIEEGVKIHASTIPYGRFQLAYELPVQIRADEAKASFRDGVLEVVLPKVEEARTRTVKVNIE